MEVGRSQYHCRYHKELTIQGIRWIIFMKSVITKIDHGGNWKESDPQMLISSVNIGGRQKLPTRRGTKGMSDNS